MDLPPGSGSGRPAGGGVPNYKRLLGEKRVQMGTVVSMQRKESPLSPAGGSHDQESSLWRTATSPPWWRTFLFRVLTGRQLTVFMYLLTCMDGNQECHPTTEEIRRFVGLNRPTMIFDAISVLDRYGFIVRYRRMMPSAGGRRNLYRRPPYEYTILRLVEHGVLDEQLRVRHDEESYTPDIMEELDAALRQMLGDGYERYAGAPEGERRGILMAELAKTARARTRHTPLAPDRDGPDFANVRLRSV